MFELANYRFCFDEQVVRNNLVHNTSFYIFVQGCVLVFFALLDIYWFVGLSLLCSIWSSIVHIGVREPVVFRGKVLLRKSEKLFIAVFASCFIVAWCQLLICLLVSWVLGLVICGTHAVFYNGPHDVFDKFAEDIV